MSTSPSCQPTEVAVGVLIRESDGALLITSRAHAENIKKLVDQLPKELK